MKSEIREITPAIAAVWLQRNGINRPLSERHVKFLMNVMADGQWKLNGESIIFSGDDRLLDGQHRLTACVRSGVTIRSMVVYDADSDVFDTIDDGRKRTGADVLSIDGQFNANRVAAAVKLVDRILRDRLTRASGYSNADIRRLVKKYHGVQKSATYLSSQKMLTGASTLIAMHYLCTLSDPHKAVTFFDSLNTGEGLHRGQPVYLLRERLIANRQSKSSLSQRYIVALFVKAWNAFYFDRKMTSLRFIEDGPKPEGFPMIENVTYENTGEHDARD
jgi:hypothetical protein